MLQLCGSNSAGFFIRGKQAGGVTCSGLAWKKIATTDDLSSYLKIAGGTMTGNLISTNVRPSASSTYYCGHSSYPWISVNSNNYYVYGSDSKCYGRMYISVTGTTSTVGQGRLYLGNNTAEGTAGNAQGALLLYGKSTGYTALLPTNNTSTNINLSLPKTTGTIPVASLSGTTLYLYT